MTTERLVLAPLTVADVDVALEMFTDPAVVKFVGRLMTDEEIRREMPVWTKRGGGGCIGIWCISDRDNGEKYGSAVLLPLPIDENDTNWNDVVPGSMPEGDVEVGFILKRSAWGKGYATEVCLRLLRFAFEEAQLEEVVATLDDENERSRNVLEKAGLVQRGRRWAYAEDSADYRITRAEWLEMNSRKQEMIASRTAESGC